jgi:hypothetical protein
MCGVHVQAFVCMAVVTACEITLWGSAGAADSIVGTGAGCGSVYTGH